MEFSDAGLRGAFLKVAKIIQIVGSSGTGKSTVSAMLESRLRNEGRTVERIYEPGPLREFIMKYRTRAGKSPWAEAALFASDRTILYSNHLRANQEGLIFVSDRGIYDSVVYQGLMGGVDLEVLKKMNSAVPWPDWGFALTVEGKTGYERIMQAHRTSRTDEVSRNETEEKINELSNRYRSLPVLFPDKKIYLIDTTAIDESSVVDAIISKLEEDSQWK